MTTCTAEITVLPPIIHGAKRTAERRSVPAAWAEDGLAVTRSINFTGWEVTHCHSGYVALGPFRTRKAAIEAARRLLELGDWTRSKTAVRADKTLVAARHALRAQLIEDEVL